MKWIQDGGHGGNDPGAVAKGNTEKIYTLEAALYVDKRLREHGISSDVTRSSDVTLDPSPRTAKVKQYHKGISHHFNAGGGSGAEFIHSIHSSGEFEALLTEEFKKESYPVRRTFSRKQSNGQDYYYMHRLTGSCRVTIVEYEFVDGVNSEKIKDRNYREGMYECIVRAICREEGISYEAPGRGNEHPEPEEQSNPSEEYPVPQINLVRGSKGEAVKQLQRALDAVNFKSGAVDGLFGPKTEDAVRRFQMVYLPHKVDGKYGPNTRRKLISVLKLNGF
ncbi:N-acetylmuramoyl-L-alanine amidase [Ferdinandcohnia quinoae]|uniref:N-acetylmuramoyl-L-alanine amidase n=1 Tax=Fredinandcohnia quinoae TaxID=2918902 RepID=UPI001F059F9B|nr:N-acetylmuramoyl-L-alanine amidase [Fredinandcohnia sp. SECRCQ15]